MEEWEVQVVNDEGRGDKVSLAWSVVAYKRK